MVFFLLFFVSVFWLVKDAGLIECCSFELEWFNQNRVISLPCYVGGKNKQRNHAVKFLKYSLSVGACGFAVALPYFFQNSMFAIFCALF